jgi:hypothetical protein
MVKCYQVYKIYRLVTNIHQIDTRYTKVARCTRNERYNNSHHRPSMPQVALTPLGLPSLAINHKSTQGSKQVMPPQVGYSITYFIHTTTN